MNNNFEGLNLLEVLETASTQFSLEEICKLSDEQKMKYDKLLERFIEVNSSSSDNAEKGKALEEISEYLLSISGGIFNIDRNLRTTTNEIDLLIKLNTKGLMLRKIDVIDKRLKCFISECKNYNKKVSVTYIGKFISLLISNQVKIGLFFSYKGISGENWNNAAGLIKKFYLSKENLQDRYCIIDFNIDEFIRIKQGDNLLQILNEKITSLRFDTDYTAYLSKHPAED